MSCEALRRVRRAVGRGAQSRLPKGGAGHEVASRDDGWPLWAGNVRLVRHRHAGAARGVSFQLCKSGVVHHRTAVWADRRSVL